MTGDTYAPFRDACDAENCVEPTPWDMSAVLFDHRLGFCSPACALAYLNDWDDIPDVVKLHDPQHYINREVVDVPADSIDLVREVDSYADVVGAIEDMSELHTGPWRVKAK